MDLLEEVIHKQKITLLNQQLKGIQTPSITLVACILIRKQRIHLVLVKLMIILEKQQKKATHFQLII